ncbi:MAG: transcriptional regulator [Deltaproteobacteria bacterium]|nr:transcriptional regulator [Deltaproteobacteria bacterium]
MSGPVRYLQDPQLAQALRLRGSELLRFGDEQQRTIGASLLQWVEEQGGYEAALAASELCKGGAESKRGCGSVERVVGGATQVMQNLDLGDVALLAGVGLLGQMTRNRVMGWMGRRVESWWNRGKPATLLAKGAGVTTEVMGITGIGVAQKIKAGQPVYVGEEFFHTGIGWLGLRLGMEGLGVVPKVLHQWGRYEVPRLAGAMTFSRVTSAFVGGTVGMVAVGQDVYQAATTQAQFMVGMRGVREFVPAYNYVATRLHTHGRFLAARLDLRKYFPPNDGFRLSNNFAWATATVGEVSNFRSRPILLEGTPRPNAGEPEPSPAWPEKVKAEWLKWLGARTTVDRTTAQETLVREYPLRIKGKTAAIAEMVAMVDTKINTNHQFAVITIRGSRKTFKKILTKAAVKLLFKRHQNLQEVCFVFVDGSAILFTKIRDNIAKYPMKPNEAGEVIADFSEQGVRVLRMTFETAAWIPPENLKPFPDLLTELRKRQGLTLGEVRERLRIEDGIEITEARLEKYEVLTDWAAPDFKVLQSLAKIYRVDVRYLIESSNRIKHGQTISAKQWKTAYFPIYFEGENDVARVRFYKQQDPKAESLGAWAYRYRKNPDHYYTRSEFAKALNIDENTLSELELNKRKPIRSTLLALSKVTGEPVANLIDRMNHTYHQALLPTLELLFPQQSVYIDSVDEEAKLAQYVKNPGSMGHVAFAYRKADYNLPRATDLKHLVGRGRDCQWSYLESGEIKVLMENVGFWGNVFQRAGLPVELLKSIYAAKGHVANTFSFDLAYAVGDASFSDVAKSSGMGRNTISHIVGGAVTDLEILVKLRRALPHLPINRMVQGQHPEAGKLFPNLLTSDGYLDVPEGWAERLAALKVGELFFARRMAMKKNAKEVGLVLGISGNQVINIELGVSGFQEDLLLVRVGQWLWPDPAEQRLMLPLLYLACRPELLKLYPVKTLTDLKPHVAPLDPVTLWSPVESVKKELKAAMQKERIASATELAKSLGYEGNEAQLATVGKRLLKVSDPLYIEDIRRIHQRFPWLSYRRMYETFFSSRLAYFLGRGATGHFNYSLPEGNNFDRLKIQVLNIIDHAADLHFDSHLAAGRAANIKVTRQGEKLSQALKREYGEVDIDHMAQVLKLDFEQRRLLYIYLNEAALKPMLEEANPR